MLGNSCYAFHVRQADTGPHGVRAGHAKPICPRSFVLFVSLLETSYSRSPPSPRQGYISPCQLPLARRFFSSRESTKYRFLLERGFFSLSWVCFLWGPPIRRGTRWEERQRARLGRAMSKSSVFLILIFFFFSLNNSGLQKVLKF